MKRIFIVSKSQHRDDEQSLYKKSSLSELDQFIRSQKTEVIYISVEELEGIKYEEKILIYRDVPLLEAEYRARSGKILGTCQGIYIDAENIDGFKKLTNTYRNESYIPFDFIIYGGKYVEIESMSSLKKPKYRLTTERSDVKIMKCHSTELWKIKSRTSNKEIIKCVIIHPNNLHGWNTRQVVKDSQYYVREMNELFLKLKNVELSMMIDSSRNISIPEMVIFKNLSITPKLINPINIEEILYSSDLILFVPSAYKYNSDYRETVKKLASEYKCEVLTLSERMNRNEKVEEIVSHNLTSETDQLVDWVKKEISAKVEVEHNEVAQNGKKKIEANNQSQLEIFITNEINKENRAIDRIKTRESWFLVDWLMREDPSYDIWINPNEMHLLSISNRLYEKIEKYSEYKIMKENKLHEHSLVIEAKNLSSRALITLKRIVGLRKGMSNSNTDKASHIEKLLYEANRYAIKDILIDICPNCCRIADFNELSVNQTIW